MSELRIYSHTGELLETRRSVDGIAAIVNGLGARFERWEASRQLGPQAAQEEVIAAYRDPIERLTRRYGFRSVDVMSITPDHPDRQALRDRFLCEHTHDDLEARFFVEGGGLFYIHAADRVYGLLCGRGDLIVVPTLTPHWFDMGPSCNFRCIRLFTTSDGWKASFTGDAIVRNFPRLEPPRYGQAQA